MDDSSAKNVFDAWARQIALSLYGKRVAVVALCALLVFSACAPTLKRTQVSSAAIEAEREKQLELALVVRANNLERLMSVASRLLISASFQCGDRIAPLYGFTVQQKNFYEEKARTAAGKALGVSDRVSVLHVYPGLPAYRAGLRKGDIILRINQDKIAGKLLSTDELRDLIKKAGHKKAVVQAATTTGNEDKKPTGHMMEVEVERGGKDMIFTLAGELACSCPVVLAENDSVNAYADGEKVVIYSGLLRLLASDDELALVVAHEISHNTLGHMTKKQFNRIPGVIADLLLASVGIYSGGTLANAAGNIFSKEFEAEADYSGLYILARAGMDISNAANLWRRMAAEHPGSIFAEYGASHPSSPERFIAMENTALEIKQKLGLGQALVPNNKEASPVEAPGEVKPVGISSQSRIEPPLPVVGSHKDLVREQGPGKGCFIKGLVRFNSKTYYTPGDRHYYDKVVDKEKGDRLFCSEAEAKEAGWSPAR